MSMLCSMWIFIICVYLAVFCSHSRKHKHARIHRYKHWFLSLVWGIFFSLCTSKQRYMETKWKKCSVFCWIVCWWCCCSQFISVGAYTICVMSSWATRICVYSCGCKRIVAVLVNKEKKPIQATTKATHQQQHNEQQHFFRVHDRTWDG